MTLIKLTTIIKGDTQRCFDASRSIDLHVLSAKHTNEIVVAGRATGLCELNDTVTWQAKHFGIVQKLQVQITKMEQPYFFEDCMLQGAFKSMCHKHYFEQKEDFTNMTDLFEYETPYSIFGKAFDALVLKRYMTNFLLRRNQILKTFVESGKPLPTPNQ